MAALATLAPFSLGRTRQDPKARVSHLACQAYPRHKVCWRATASDTSGNYLRGSVRDVSRFGLFLESNANNLVPGRWVRISLTLPNGRRIEVSGEVRWTGARHDNAEGFGVEFVGPVADIDAYLASEEDQDLE